MRFASGVSLILLLPLACSAPERSDGVADGTWVGTITTEGNVTTVVNQSGSVWGGTARRVEEASIGVEAGDDRRYLVHLYELDGVHIETWDTDHRVRGFAQMTVTHDGRVITRVSLPAEEGAERRGGMQMFGAEGPIGSLLVLPTFDFEPVSVLAESGSRVGVRFPPQYPNMYRALDASERMIAGVATNYRFDIRLPDGTTVVVEKYWDPVPIPEQERSDARSQLTNWARTIDPEWRWEIPPIPEHRPPFSGIVPAGSGEVWVLRLMESRPMKDCVKDVIGFEECWQQDTAYDVFEPGGRFLGTVPAPEGLIPYLVPHIAGNVFIGVIEDPDGIQYVKRYRLVPPGEEKEER